MIPVKLLALLLVLVPQQAERAVVKPDPELQAGFERLLAAETSEAQQAALEFLRANAGPDDARLVPQLVLFSEAARDTHAAMLFGFVRSALPIPDEALVRALVPLLESPDPARCAAVGGVLSELEDRSIERGADFSLYQPFLAAEPPAGLARHLFETDPDAALLLLLRARTSDVAEQRPLLFAWHELKDLRWKLANGFLAREDLARTAPEALRSLDLLARHGRWWARLAAARLVLEEPALRTAARLETLARDENELVRATALAAQAPR